MDAFDTKKEDTHVAMTFVQAQEGSSIVVNETSQNRTANFPFDYKWLVFDLNPV